MERRSRAVAALVAAAALSALSACGGSEESAAADEPVRPAQSTGSPTAAGTPASDAPKPTRTPKPLSRFEDEPPVRVARAWAVGVAKAVNAGDRQLGAIRPLTTAAGQERMVGYVAEDAGLYYPGPLPFTPTGVRVDGDTASVPMCLWAEGFALDRRTKQPTKPRLIGEAALWLKREGGGWKVDDLLAADVDCSKVPVKGRGW